MYFYKNKSKEKMEYELINQIYDIRQKITDEEYKQMNDTFLKIQEKNESVNTKKKNVIRYLERRAETLHYRLEIVYVNEIFRFFSRNNIKVDLEPSSLFMYLFRKMCPDENPEKFKSWKKTSFFEMLKMCCKIKKLEWKLEKLIYNKENHCLEIITNENEDCPCCSVQEFLYSIYNPNNMMETIDFKVFYYPNAEGFFPWVIKSSIDKRKYTVDIDFDIDR